MAVRRIDLKGLMVEYLMIERALEIATLAHTGQKDWFDNDYVLHPIAVSELCIGENSKVAALLHDVVEDTPNTLEDLRRAGINEEILVAVDILTKRKNIETLDEYHARIATNDIAIEVKFADMRHNSDTTRFPKGNEERANSNSKKYRERVTALLEIVGKEKAQRVLSSDMFDFVMSCY